MSLFLIEGILWLKRRASARNAMEVCFSKKPEKVFFYVAGSATRGFLWKNLWN